MTDREQRTAVRVLVVEDNPHVAELIVDGLDGASRRELGGKVQFEFDIVHDGQIALEHIRTTIPDLIICDIYMPILDGASLIKRLRHSDVLAAVPVLALSAGGETARAAALEAGANAFLDKPVRLQEVLELALQLLGLRQPRA